MKHLIICSEYPPAPGGGIGTYVYHVSKLLAENGEIVHVIGQLWEGAENTITHQCSDRLIIHRVPFLDWKTSFGEKLHPAVKSTTAKKLFKSGFTPQCFSWQAAALAETLIVEEGIDVLEAQEFEAPLHFLQFRRAVKKYKASEQPPCIIHFHSPTEFTAKHNDFDLNKPYFQAEKKIEDFSIGAADAYLCPSKYLARQVAEHYTIDDTIKIIPYPIGEIPFVERDESVWKNGTVCYVGRLERRKGVIEWLDAAVEVARQNLGVHFDFVGENVLSTDTMCAEEFVQRRIPKALKKRFHFHGGQKRELIPHFLAKARIAVVPSRWENFPYTCIEQMCSGLPVLVSPEGGMKEMVQDGVSGWVAKEMSSTALAAALKRALDASPAMLAEMGQNALHGIRKLCNDKTIFDLHMNFRREVVAKGCWRSLHSSQQFDSHNDSPDIAEGIFFNVENGFLPSPYCSRLTLKKLISMAKMGFFCPQRTIKPVFKKVLKKVL